jgi:hypothetical protein
MPPRVSQAQLERAVGGADKLLQLIDKTRTDTLSSVACQDFIEEVLDEANGDVNGFVGLAVDLSDPALQTAPQLVRYELALAVELAWLKGTGAQATPEKVTAEAERARGQLQLIADRKKGIGLATRPAAAQQVQQVIKTNQEPYFSTSSPRKRFDGWS